MGLTRSQNNEIFQIFFRENLLRGATRRDKRLRMPGRAQAVTLVIT